MNTISWNIIDKYFKDNPYNLVAHHLDSYNDFFSRYIFQIFKDNNPIRFIERETISETIGIGENVNEVHLYMGGKDANKIYFGKPIIYDDNNDNNNNERESKFIHYMYPNDARLRSMTYGMTIHYDIDVEFIIYENEKKIILTKTLEKIYLGRFPIMVQSNLCILKGMSRQAIYNCGECKNDYGGYFIIDGKEKVILSQEKFADNMLYVRKGKEGDLYSYSCEVHSVSEDTSKPIRYSAVRMLAPDTKYTNNQIVVDIPNVRKPIPLFILMRALGVISDRDIIKTCILDLNANNNLIDLFIPSIHDSANITTQEIALKFIATFVKRQSVESVQEILVNYFIPHVGENNFLDKAYYVGMMVLNMLNVIIGRSIPTDRDNFKFKRIELSGSLIYDLFREYYLIQNRNIWLKIDKEYYYHTGKYKNNFVSLIEDNVMLYFKERIVEDGFKKAFKGNWGASSNTKKLGLIQDLNRLSWFTFISHLRKINLPMDATAKVVAPHLLHASQWGYIDPVDTPDGANVGLHKHLALSCAITNGYSSVPLIKWLRTNSGLKLLQECNSEYLYANTKVLVNGNWIGVINNPLITLNMIKLFKKNGVIPLYTSVSFNYKENILYLYTDSGRLIRPLFYRNMQIDNNNGLVYYNNISYNRNNIIQLIEKSLFTWEQVVCGFGKKADKNFNIRNNILYDSTKLYPQYNNLEELIEFFEENKAVLDFVDCAEQESLFIANNFEESENNKYYTHVEIDPSLLFGVMGNSIIYPEYNQLPRDVFSCGQSRQAVSLYHSNFQNRLDKMGVVLNYGQIPLVKSRYLKYINNEEQPYGVNAVVAIMSYTGYNVEDAILINEGSIKRGLFNTTYYTSYEDREESTKVSGSINNKIFNNIEKKIGVVNLKPGYDYSKLDEYGLVKENTLIDDRVVLIGKIISSSNNKEQFIDSSTFTKKGQLGFVDKSFISEGEEGFRIAKVRIREERIPAIGDKMASRSGQKGTIGLIIPEEDMPFNSEGIRPDLIINPHAIPSRMTIGQLIEALFGKVCSLYGGFGDCTAYATKGSNYELYGKLLVNMGYNKTGNEILYNGYTGEQIYSEIYIGPTYYMRLKHMVKDKINYRETGKRSILTRQTNQGRANDGGLRIGEMERDGILANGMSYFLNESFMVRGDEYYIAICNKTGLISIYNPNQNLFFSPGADGPVKFNMSLDGNFIIDTLSKFGRSFSILRVPYSFKLLMQELQVMNVQMRLITEDNIDQLMNLSYQSKSLNRLLFLDDKDEIQKEINEIINDYKNNIIQKLEGKEEIKEERKEKEILLETPETPETSETPEIKELPSSESPQFKLGSPQYIPEGSPSEYAPFSPAYRPPSQPKDNSNSSIEYAPFSPAYRPPTENIEQQGTPSSPEFNPFEEKVIKGGTGTSLSETEITCFNNLSKDKQDILMKLPNEQKKNILNQIINETLNLKMNKKTNNVNIINPNDENNILKDLNIDILKTDNSIEIEEKKNNINNEITDKNNTENINNDNSSQEFKGEINVIKKIN